MSVYIVQIVYIVGDDVIRCLEGVVCNNWLSVFRIACCPHIPPFFAKQ